MASSIDKLAKELKNQIAASDERKPRPYDTQAEVLRVENGVAWVHIPGGVDETPVRLTINAKKGDTVNIHVANGTAWITGNSTNPPTDDSTADYAVDISNEVKKDVMVLNTVVAENIEATNARFTNVEADTAKIHDLTADNLHATVGYIEDLTADNITAQDIYASSGYIKDLEADNIAAQDISASSGYIKDLTAGNVTAQNVIADHATVGSLDTTYAKINAANIDTATIRNAWVDKIMVQTGLLAYSSQIYTLDAIEVNAANITAGTLDVNRLIVTVGEGSSAQKYLVNIDPSTGTPSYEKLDGNIVEPRTITADKIVAGAITTNEITTNNLIGTNGWINLHEGKFFYGDGTNFASATNAISWNGSKLQIKADEFLLSTGQTIQDSIESVENWFYSVPPTTSNPPANSWTTTNLKEQHLRDIYFDTTSGKSYRWSKDNNVYSWVEIEDVELAALAKDLHDNYPPRSEFTIAPNQINAEVSKKVGNDEVIAKINASVEESGGSAVKISADKVNIEGAAIFTGSGRLSTTSLNNSYDAKGAAQEAVDGIEVGGRNLFGYGSDCQNSLDGLVQSTVKFSIVTEDGIKCAHISGQKNNTGYLASSILYTPKPLEWFTFSAWVKLKNISAGTTNYLLGTYFGGENISGSWRGVQNVSIYVDGVKKSGDQGRWTEYIADTNWHHLVITARYQNYAYSTNFRGYVYARDFTGDMYVHHIKWERGTKATDWTPTPEEVQAEIDAKKSVHTLDTAYSYTYAQILTYSAEGYSGGWTTSSNAGVKVGDTVRLKVTVSDMSNAPVYVVGTITEVMSNDTGVRMTSHGLDTTIIDGGNILTNSITALQIDAGAVTASKLAIGDFNNYITVNENNEDTLVYGFVIEDGWLYKNVATASNAWLSPVLARWGNEGDQFRVTGKVKTNVAGRVRVIIYGRTDTGTANGSVATSYIATTANTEKEFSGVITISSTVAANPQMNIAIQFVPPSDTSGYIVGYCKEMRCERIAPYITQINENGIRIHPAATENNSVVINDSGMEVFKGGTDDDYSVAKYGDTVRIGKDANQHIYIGPGSFSIGKGVNNANQYMNVFIMDGRTPDDDTITGAYYAFTNMGSSVEPPSDSLFGFMLGYYCEATGFCAKAMGEGIIVHYDNQTAIGKYNANDSGNAFEIGWGTANAPKNIFAVDVGGNTIIPDDAEYRGGHSKTNFTPTHCSNYANYGGCYYEKFGPIVHVHVGVSGLTANTATNIKTLPSDFRPPSTVFAHGTGGAWNNLGYLQVDSSGVVMVRSEGTYCGADVTFMV